MYWSDLVYATDASRAWYFGVDYGYQFTSNKDDDFNVWAVRPGDVAAAPAPSGVPEPTTVALLALGLLGLGLTRRRG